MPVQVTIEPLIVDRETAAAMLRNMSVSTFEALTRKEELLKPRMVGDRLVGWPVDNLRAWANTRPISDQLPPPDCQVGRRGKKRNTTAQKAA